MVQGLVFVLVFRVPIHVPHNVLKTVQAVSEQEIFQAVFKKNMFSKTDFLTKFLGL